MAGRLTKRAVDALAPSAAEYVRWDGELKGFGVRVRPSGAKSFIAMYRTGGRNSSARKVTIGSFGRLTVDQAREEAKAILARADLGQDVAAERAKTRAEMTMSALCDVYLEDVKGLKKPSTLSSDRSRIARHIKPLLGTKRLGEVTRADVERFMRDVAAGKTAVDERTGKRGRAIVTGGRGTATRTVRLLGGIFSFAIGRGWRTDNPTKGVQKYADAKGERFLSSDDLARLGGAIRLAETEGVEWKTDPDQPPSKHLPRNDAFKRTRIGPDASAALRLLIFTGCRLREVLNLEWRHVDLERGLLLLPDSKTGAKPVVLGAAAVSVLADYAEACRSQADRFVFPSADPERPRSDLKRPWALVIRHAGLDGLRIHDLRHTFASVGAAGGLGLTIVGTLLGHADPKTTSRYSHFDNDPLRRAADAIGGYIARAMSAGDEKSPS